MGGCQRSSSSQQQWCKHKRLATAAGVAALFGAAASVTALFGPIASVAALFGATASVTALCGAYRKCRSVVWGRRKCRSAGGGHRKSCKHKRLATVASVAALVGPLLQVTQLCLGPPSKSGAYCRSQHRPSPTVPGSVLMSAPAAPCDEHAGTRLQKSAWYRYTHKGGDKDLVGAGWLPSSTRPACLVPASVRSANTGSATTNTKGPVNHCHCPGIMLCLVTAQLSWKRSTPPQPALTPSSPHTPHPGPAMLPCPGDEPPLLQLHHHPRHTA